MTNECYPLFELAVSFSGTDLNNFLKQWVQYGLKGKIPIADPFLSESNLWSLDKDSSEGTYTKVWQYSDPNLSPIKRKFRRQLSRQIRRIK